MKFFKSFAFVVFVFLLIVSAVFWITIKKDHPEKRSNDHKTLIEGILKDSKSVFRHELINAKSKVLVIIFFNLEDCPTCLFESQYWAGCRNYFTEKEVKLVGVTSTGDPELLSEYISEYKIEFPILQDKNGDLTQDVLRIIEKPTGIISTPFKIFLNSDLQLMQIEGALKDPAEQEKLVQKLKGFLYSVKKTQKK